MGIIMTQEFQLNILSFPPVFHFQFPVSPGRAQIPQLIKSTYPCPVRKETIFGKAGTIVSNVITTKTTRKWLRSDISKNVLMNGPHLRYLQAIVIPYLSLVCF